MQKDPEERYQTINDVLIDLKDVKRDLEFQDKLERSIIPNQDGNKTQILKSSTDDEIHQTAISQTIVKNPAKKYLAVILAVLLLSTAAFFGYKYFAPADKQIESIAVMPFVNESSNPDVDYLSDGMTEMLINSLSQIPNLNIKARSLVFHYKGKEITPKKLASELNVQAVLNGHVGQRGDQLTLSLELIDGETENVIWSESYNRKQTDIVSLQSEIARDVSRKVKAKLSGADEQIVTQAATSDPEAYRAFLKGRYYWNRRSPENLKKAIEQFKTATDRDPDYALAYAGLADCYAVFDGYAGVPTSETLPQVQSYAARALSLNPQLGEPHAALGLTLKKQWQWAESEKEFKRAIEVNPNYPTVYHWYFILLSNLGRQDEALATIQRAHDLDPLSSIINDNLADQYTYQKDYEKAVIVLQNLLELDPNFGYAYMNLGRAYFKLGREREAFAALEKCLQMTNRYFAALGWLGYINGKTGKRAEALAIIKEMEEKYNRKESDGLSIASVYAGLGDRDKTFEWLEKDFQTHSGGISYLKNSIVADEFRDDPRYKDLLKRMGLPE